MKNLGESEISLTEQTNIIRLVAGLSVLEQLQHSFSDNHDSITPKTHHIVAEKYEQLELRLRHEMNDVFVNYGEDICADSIEFMSAIKYCPELKTRLVP